MNTLEDKLGLLTQTKKDLKLSLGIREDVPFSKFIDYIPFTPYYLFTGNRVGIWLDPSDLSTMFQDSKGTIPVTKDGDPVGLILDKSKGLFGDELVKNDFNDWIQAVYPSTITVSEGVLTVSNDDLGSSYSGASNKTPFNTVVGKQYILSIDVVSDRRGHWLILSDSHSSDLTNRKTIVSTSQYGKKTWTYIFTATSNTTYLHVNRGTTAGNYVSVSNLSIRELKGNHATQSVSAARPIYRTDGFKHWLEFDGIDDILETSNSFTINQGFYACAAVSIRQYDTKASGTNILGISYSVHNQGINIRASAGAGASQINVSSRSGISADSVGFGSAFNLNEIFIHSAGHTIDNTLYVEKNSSNRQLKSDVILSEITGAKLNIGGVPTNLNFYGGVFLVSSLDNSKDIEKYLANKSGVTL